MFSAEKRAIPRFELMSWWLQWARVFNEDKFDLAFPQQVAKDQSPTELNAFMKQLYAEFHDKPCNCRNNHQGLEDEGFYKGDDIEKGGKFAIAFPPGM